MRTEELVWTLATQSLVAVSPATLVTRVEQVGTPECNVTLCRCRLRTQNTIFLTFWCKTYTVNTLLKYKVGEAPVRIYKYTLCLVKQLHLSHILLISENLRCYIKTVVIRIFNVLCSNMTQLNVES